jgi:hypothetical protein
MSQKTKIIIGTSCILVLLSAGMCFAGDINQELLSKWRNDHHQCVVRLIGAYLKSSPASEQQEFIEELARLESMMATCSRDVNDFYLDKVSTDSLEIIPAEVLFIYLEKNGVSMDARSFFEGRQFKYFKQEL